MDALLLTGGMAHSERVVSRCARDMEWIAPIRVYPGENELQALAEGVFRVLDGVERAKRLREEEGVQRRLWRRESVWSSGWNKHRTPPHNAGCPILPWWILVERVGHTHRRITRSRRQLAPPQVVQAAALWPAHCITPRNLLHGPTASRYGCAMTREIWCRWVRSCAAQAASSCPSVTFPAPGADPAARNPPARPNARSSSRFAAPQTRKLVQQRIHRQLSLSFKFPADREDQTRAPRRAQEQPLPAASSPRVRGGSNAQPRQPALHVPSPSIARVQNSGKPRSSALRAAGVRSEERWCW